MNVQQIIILVVSVLLLFYVLWNEIRRANKSRLLGRIIASIVAVTSLACLALPVAFNVTKNTDASGVAILLTPGFDKDSLRSFLNNSAKQIPVYTTDENVAKLASSYKPTLVSGIENLHQSSVKFNAIHVFGYGLNEDELQQLNTAIVFHSSSIPTGITTIDWQRRLTAGDRFKVQGKFNNTLSNDVKLVLKGLNTNLDSIVVPKNTFNEFELTTIPKHLDRSVYYVVALNGKDTLETGDIPLEVIQPKKLRVLMLASSPDFESKFLKNWLAENGYAVASRIRISKEKFHKEYVNITGFEAGRISAGGLDKFDVVIADAEELSAISKPELAIIQSQVQSKGMGLIIKADSAVGRVPFYARNFSIITSKDNKRKEISVSLKNATTAATKLPVDLPVYISAGLGTQSLIKNERSAVYAASTIFGNGKIILTTLQNTYSLSLSGQKDNYSNIWTLLLNGAAKKTARSETVTLAPALPVINHPAILSIHSSNSTQPGQLGEDKIYFEQDDLLPFIHTGKYWPTEAGWVPAVDAAGKTDWFYIYEKNSWPTVNAAAKIAIAKIYASQHAQGSLIKNTKQEKIRVEVPKLYFFLIFLLASGFLWFEKKLR